ncbi:MAG: cold-shock protein [Actinomycetota bacterium]
MVETGRVKSFDRTSGEGWIVPGDWTSRDVFVRRSSILDEGLKNLPVDGQVTYQSRTTAAGLEAFNVSVTK